MNNILSRISQSVLAASFGLTLVAGQAIAADDYPSRSTSIVVGFSPGGTTDVLARIVAKELSEELGKSFIVENKTGAGSNIATDFVKRAKPDGYTLLMMAVTSTINQTLYKNIKFDVKKDFDPIVLVSTVPNVLVANKKAPFQTFEEFESYVKENPGKVAVSSSGSGTSMHLAAELYKQQADVDMLHIPYKGSGPAMTALLSHEVDVMFDNMPSSAPHIKQDALNAFAVTSDERSEAFPDLPTMKEIGYPEYSVTSWFGLVAPKGTPSEIVEKLNKTVDKILEKPEIVKQLDGLGATYQKNSPDEFGQFISDETDKWGEVVTKGNIQVD